jgi:hypothetical protein
MCRRVECSKCGRPTWAGCGAHVEQVLGNVPEDERCRCHEAKLKARRSEAPEEPRSWLRGLFER